ncbi:MAG TPA: UDP-3-O-(3-hydroxymyristoyl)glucosamine N-acyltransferase [Planctomycetes bacterium]|nr:UDP-3-O-(3-hydroxymyristoyl)glucosamine N-acyltransferase [Planctomycetota bacterium]
MEITVKELAEKVGARIEGEEDLSIHDVCALDATGIEPGRIAFHAGEAPPEALDSGASSASAFLVQEGRKDLPGPAEGKAYLWVEDPYLAFAEIACCFHPLPIAQETSLHPSAIIDLDTKIGDPVVVGPHAVLEKGVQVGAGTRIMAGAFLGKGVVLGENCVVHPGVCIYPGVRVGNRVQIHAGAVLGSDGFGNARRPDGSWQRIPQIGTVVVEDDVEIGANTCIDRATFAETRIRRGSRIDNLVHVGHNCILGEHAAVAAQTGFSGHTILGDRVRVGGQAGFAGHLRVCDDAAFGGKAGVFGNVEKPAFYLGGPIRTAREFWRLWAELARLPEMRKQLRSLLKKQK